MWKIYTHHGSRNRVWYFGNIRKQNQNKICISFGFTKITFQHKRYICTLKKELQSYLKELSSTHTEKNTDRSKIHFRNNEISSQSTAFDIKNSNVLYAASPSFASIVVLELKYNRIGISAKIIKFIIMKTIGELFIVLEKLNM